MCSDRHHYVPCSGGKSFVCVSAQVMTTIIDSQCRTVCSTRCTAVDAVRSQRLWLQMYGQPHASYCVTAVHLEQKPAMPCVACRALFCRMKAGFVRHMRRAQRIRPDRHLPCTINELFASARFAFARRCIRRVIRICSRSQALMFQIAIHETALASRTPVRSPQGLLDFGFRQVSLHVALMNLHDSA